MNTGEDLILETLKVARASVKNAIYGEDEPTLNTWDYGDWSRCTCGHIYQAAGYSDGNIQAIVYPTTVNGVYEATMLAIAEANPEVPNSSGLTGFAVSDATTQVGLRMSGFEMEQYEGCEEYQEYQRQAALVLIENTIKMIEAEHEKARQECLASATTPKELVTA